MERNLLVFGKIIEEGKSFDEEGKEIGEYVNGEEEIYYKPPF